MVCRVAENGERLEGETIQGSCCYMVNMSSNKGLDQVDLVVGKENMIGKGTLEKESVGLIEYSGEEKEIR